MPELSLPWIIFRQRFILYAGNAVGFLDDKLGDFKDGIFSRIAEIDRLPNIRGIHLLRNRPDGRRPRKPDRAKQPRPGGYPPFGDREF